MIIIGRKIIVDFEKSHPQSRKPLAAWQAVMQKTNYEGFNKLKQTFGSIDYAHGRYTIFDIGGNKFRLITEVDYAASVVNIKRMWTHAEYSMPKNKDALRGGKI